ncbi:hypothetical protein QQS21_006210 [Conoideocrella luteorostrata]|uniref:Rhodopsin domain-containing protein n=1 Tax=Conoideocrella luteorostrata TaxID=1105319 RepID=A0AAJ0CN49_9HYPO|nr:hypothetical protein QQS21_006210 [Conoideocrella luteorostrata]
MHPSEIVEFARYFFIQQILYIFLMTSIKLSLLCFYLTIFPGKKTRLVLWLTVAMNIMFGIIFTTISVFQCTPVRFYWMQYVQESDGQCININLTGWLNGAVSVVIDLWMIGIPLFQIKKLELHWKKKVGAAVMFLTGAFVTVVSILRLQSLLYFYSSLNPTWDLWHTAWWSTIEINIGLICACLPTIRLLLVRMWPRVFGSTINSTMARSRASRGNSMMVRRQQVRIASLEIQLDEAPPNSKEEHWQPSPTGNQQHWEASSTGAEEQWDEHFYHAK